MKISEQFDNVEEKLGGQFNVIFCIAHLVANGVLSLDDTMETANRYWIEEMKENCWNCSYSNTCFACAREA